VSFKYTIGVIIPSYKVKKHILDVISSIGEECDRIYVVDDCCPEGSGVYVEEECRDPRVRVLYHEENQGVGGAVMTGYQQAMKDGVEVMIKLDGDGQMDPSLIPLFADPVLRGEADYTKGNRFFDLESLESMPKARLFGNSVLSFMTKLSSGYWNIFDPTNGYTALHSSVAGFVPFQKISRRYFFETDMLFRLNTIRAVVVDIPMSAKYQDEVSNLKIRQVIGEFLCKHVRNLSKRIFYNYYLRDMSLASIQLPVGVFLFIFGLLYGVYHWYVAFVAQVFTPVGTVMLSALSLLMGVQLILSFIGFDIASVPVKSVQGRLKKPAGSNE
jgi:dolichol-phosphate mannosyltransferase